MADVFNKVHGWLRDEKVLPPSVKFIDFNLLYRGIELKES